MTKIYKLILTDEEALTLRLFLGSHSTYNLDSKKLDNIVEKLKEQGI